ncbi:phosphotransferase [Alkalihalobacillus sp. LMS39]|uniref:phosphotransferase enzyme family protein n=1 Tax=Alkalihalobacillus sp. LMS39 TaxID=2924032 RepID=UPI001FB3BD5E|nr:phosphotransferase [Alkalihalobacillus sp. LMS39]UOE95386.1 phosphotransferase [Alkalihalobacillus sp. LMS39]
MEKEIEILFTEKIINEAVDRFQLKKDSLKKLGSFENYVYECIKDDNSYILRFTHSSHRSKAQIESELDWVNFLKEKNAPVCGPLRSSSGCFVEEIQATDGSSFFSCLFEKAQGSPVKVTDEQFNEKLFHQWGKSIGRLHTLTEHYTLPDHIQKRHELIVGFDTEFAPYLPSDKVIQKNAQDVIAQLNNIPKTEKTFGLIHTDLHLGNFFYDGETMYLFDFDDCGYHYLLSDIAIAIYYTCWFNDNTDEENTNLIHQFIPAFISGYREEHSFLAEDLRLLPLFFHLRDLELLGVLHKKWDVSALNEKQQKLLDDLYSRVKNQTPIVQFDIEAMVVHLHS